MKNQQIVLFLFALLMAPSGAAAQALDWKTVEKLAPNTRIWIKTQRQTYCYFEKASDERLSCNFLLKPSSSEAWDPDLVFLRKDIREVHIAYHDDYDASKGFLTFLFAAGGGGGLDSAHQPNAFAGVKVGGPFSLDLQYDRIRGKSGFSTEGSGVIPLFRVPGYHPYSTSPFVKVYAEPGVGYRAGSGAFGGYTSAKVLLLLWNSPWKSDWSPYVEFQSRFPFESPQQGDNRFTIGVMSVVCRSCGFD